MMNMTYAQAIDNALEMIDTTLATDPSMWENLDVTRDKLEALKVQLAKRGTSKTPTKTQKENEGVMETILEVLADNGDRMTVTEMLADDRLNGYTNQKISALLRKLRDAKKVDKIMEKKKAYFTLVE